MRSFLSYQRLIQLTSLVDQKNSENNEKATVVELLTSVIGKCRDLSMSRRARRSIISLGLWLRQIINEVEQNIVICQWREGLHQQVYRAS